MIQRLYGLALRAFPKRHRDLYRAEMLDAFNQALDARRTGGPTAITRFVVAACLDAIGNGIVERRRRHVVRFGYAFSSLDFLLAWRMLVRYPGLSVVSVFGMAVGIAVATTAFTVVAMLMDTRLPLPDGDRIVSLVSTDAAASEFREFRLAHDYAAWRGMTSMQDLGVSRDVARNLIIEGHTPEPVTVAEISSSGFHVAGVSAFRGRVLLEDDEAAGAPAVVVIGYDEWIERFQGDQDIIGKSVQLGSATHQVVGVMPEGFGFPVNHSFWIPFHIDAEAYEPLTGPRLGVFGRLAPGATIESAQAELTEFGRRAAADSPATHQHLRPRVMPYVYAFTDMGEPQNFLAMSAIETTLVLLLIIVCVNVAILVYARTATRTGEIAVRSALGASRRRIVTQLFVEALTMAGLAAVIGVSVVSVALPLLKAGFLGIVGGKMPFWMDMSLSTDSAVVAIALTLLAAGIVGVMPAIKATSRSVQTRVQTLSPGSGSRMQMGRVWTLLIVAQVAITVALLPGAMFFTWDGLRLRTGDAGFASRQIIGASLSMDRSLESAANESAFKDRFAAAHRVLDERLKAEPQVTTVTFSLANPGEELAMALEADGQPVPAEPVHYGMQDGTRAGHLVRYNRVATNFFEAFEVPLLLGRTFSPGDAGTDRVIINRALAQRAFGSTNPLGGHVKYVGRSREAFVDDDYLKRAPGMPAAVPLERWYEVVGVVPDFPVDETNDEFDARPRVYHPASIGDLYPPRINVRVRAGAPSSFADTLREVSAAVSVDLQLQDITTTEILAARERGVFRMVGLTVGTVMLSVITLSAAGIHALMSFTVVRRRREIGIRAALGADRNQLLRGIFARALGQVAVGAVIGVVGAIGVELLLEGEIIQHQGAIILPLVALLMAGVGVLAVIGPAREGLRIQPIEALRDE